MRVCLLAPEFLPNWGGVGTYTVELAKQLAKLVDLSVITVARNYAGRSASKEFMEETLGDKAEVHVVAGAKDTFLYNAGFQVAVLREFKRLVARDRFDIIHSQHAHMPDLLFRQVNERPAQITTVHTTIRGQLEAIRIARHLGGTLESSEEMQVALRPLLRLAEKLALRKNGHYITVSDWMRQELQSRGIPEERITVIDNGVDVDRFYPSASRENGGNDGSGRLRVVFSGRPTVVKGAAVLARAIPKILAEVPGAEFVFTGGGPGEFDGWFPMDDWSKASIRFLGYIDYAELPQVYASADIAVLPTFYENVPLRLLELMACGVPVVSSAVGGIPEVITAGKDGVLTQPGSSTGLAEAVTNLLQDEDARRRIGSAARQTVLARFSWARTARETLQAYGVALGVGG